MTGYVLEKLYFEHNPNLMHPENPKRLAVITDVLETYPKKEKLKKINARPATKEEICLIHDPAYFETIKETQGKTFVQLDPDTSTSERSYESACLAAGGVLTLIDQVFAQKITNGFAFVRPPGHHAERERAMGFCLFNNVAIGAAYALKKYNLKKILIIDFDLHHGNGTQHAFYDSNQVLYISTHQFPYYPGTGSFEEIGEGEGRGYNLNFPLSIGAGDSMYFNIFSKIILPVALQFKPELILVSCGFDIYYQDPLGGMQVTKNGFASLAQVILKIAKKCCQSRVVFTLEGGYDLTGIKEGTKAILDELTLFSKREIDFPETSDFLEYKKKAHINFYRYWEF